MIKKVQSSEKSSLKDSVIDLIGEYKYSPEKDVTFAVYFRRYEEVFQKDCATLSDEKKNTPRKNSVKVNRKSMLTTYFQDIIKRYQYKSLY